ncbi:hypothetical protein PJP14_29640, partial [Mycobacterium kansasii]
EDNSHRKKNKIKSHNPTTDALVQTKIIHCPKQQMRRITLEEIGTSISAANWESLSANALLVISSILIMISQQRVSSV